MVFVLIGIALIVCHFMDWGPMATWTWTLTDGHGNWGDLWKFLLPFVLAAIWWAWADASGLSKKRAMQRDAERKQDRRDRNIDAMGLGHLHKHRDGQKRAKR